MICTHIKKNTRGGQKFSNYSSEFVFHRVAPLTRGRGVNIGELHPVSGTLQVLVPHVPHDDPCSIYVVVTFPHLPKRKL